MKRVAIFLAAFLPALSFAELKLPVPELETLSNGLTVAWFVNKNLPVVDLALLVQSGYRDDPAGKSGTAELVAASLDRGADGMDARKIARAVEMLGASRYINSDDDTFTVGMHGLAPDADELLGLLTKLTLKPEFPETEVAREKARLGDRWKHIGDSGETLASIAFHRLVAAGTDYGRGSLSSLKELQAVSRADVLAYHQAHFVPKNSVLMVVGRVEKEEFRKKLLASFGGWTGEAPKRAWKPHTDRRLGARKGEILVVEREDLTQAQVRIGFKGPSFHSPERYSLVVANALLGEYFYSRLNAVIRDKLGLTYGIGSAFSYSKDIGKFAVGSATRNDAVGPLIKKTVEILEDLKKGPIPEDEIRMAKEYLVGGYPLSVSTVGAVASRWLAGYVFGLGPEYLNEFVPKVKGVTQQDVLSAVKKHFRLDDLVIVVAGNGKEIEKSLKEAGFRSIRRVSAQALM